MHSAFALRYLYANLGELKARSQIREYTIQQRPIDIAEDLLKLKPTLIGFSVYIWNVEETAEVLALIKQVAPQVKIIVGGPEVSFINDQPALVALSDYVITGPGEESFYQLCKSLLAERPTLNSVINGVAKPLDELALPYADYNEEDIRNRLIYVEASRGCPFKCEFCLSALDKTAKPFALDKFLNEMSLLHERGARNFKFIDRTFNLKTSSSVAILEFFLARMSDDLYLHFEVIPDHLPEALKAALVKFPTGSLQFEIGVQTFDSDIQALISRKQDNDKTCNNIRWLRQNTGAHIHADLIFGLPGDNLDNFAQSFNRLFALGPQEIQLGILKRLRGAPINRHTDRYKLRYNPRSPYNILSTKDIGFDTMQRVNRFARFWEMIGNSGRFRDTLPLILGADAFHRFLCLSDALFNAAGSTWKISLKNLFELLFAVMTEHLDIADEETQRVLLSDFQRSGQKGRLKFQQENITVLKRSGVANKRQKQHLA